MSGTPLAGRVAAFTDRLSLPAVGLTALVVAAELALVASYLALTDAKATSVRYLLYPFVWVNVAAWAVFRTDPPPASTRVRWLVTALAAGYLAVLAYAGGVLDIAHLTHGHSHGYSGLAVFTALPPGWGPTVVYDHALFTLRLTPYKVVGYLALAYLVYAALLETASAAVSGVIGLLSCVSCSWPVFASLLAGAAGGSVGAAAVYSYSVDISTAAFVAAAVLLVWRPGLPSQS
jgi:hypothetical protein